MSDETPYLDPIAREVVEEAASVSREQVERLLSRKPRLAAIQTKPGPNWVRHGIDRAEAERRLAQARTDFQTIIGWIDAKVFDAEACRALCFAAIESLEAKTG